MTLPNQDQNKKSFLRKIFSSNDKSRKKRGSFDSSDQYSESSIRCLLPHSKSNSMPQSEAQPFRVFVATWNVGGKSPHDEMNLDDLLQIHNPSDIYVIGFQEIVPLNAGNVLVVEDNEPAAKWLSLINQSLNQSHSAVSRKPKSLSPIGSSLPFQKPFLKKFCDKFRTDSGRSLKSCNCTHSFERNDSKEYCLWPPQTNINEGDFSFEEDEDGFSSYLSSEISAASAASQMKYSLIMAKQMVGIFLTIWVKKELVPNVGHLRTSCTGRGIMGRLGNKGCVSVSMTVHQTSFCFVCSHLASGEKEGDELRRNADVVEIHKNTQFQRICRSPYSVVPERILGHDRVIWLGDLNYRIALGYSETRKLLEKNDWDALFDKDQLKIEREAGRVFSGWKEGKIYFAPTYKYSYNSDTYAGETAETKKKRRTPAWCDRILWHGNGIRQLSYIRLESQLSDHRPVCSTFLVDVEVMKTTRKGSSGYNMKVARTTELNITDTRPERRLKILASVSKPLGLDTYLTGVAMLPDLYRTFCNWKVRRRLCHVK